ncbi:MAG: sulfatase-like hydrolase/transferase [Candidatus Omnitrophica bacterium]|nr:sulfatase-like hydrolase/transferase [Candidatus Omnitrophota bacterium]
MATNFLVILTDDQGPWAAGCYGNSEIQTPNLDRLAASGMRLENFFCATPVCSPSRATLLTGRLPSQHGIHDWIKQGNVGPDSIRYLEGEVALTDVLARSGYVCGLSGKWHLGDSQVPQHGFTDWYVHQKGGGDYNQPPMVREGRCVGENGYVTKLITDEALKFLRSYACRKVPFYLGVHYTAPHSPWTGHPEEIVHLYDRCQFKSCPQEPRHPWAIELTDLCLGNREMLQGYFAAVTAMDIEVGRILEALQELGLRETTLVAFLSDNGFSCGHHGFWGKGNGTVPWNMYENSIRVPALFSQPGTIPARHLSSELVSAYDFFPTLLDWAGLPLPKNRTLPGKSFRSLLLGRQEKGRDEVVIYDEYGPVRMIRTKEWKYVHRHPWGPPELYHLADDPDERKNLSGDSRFSQVEKELKEKLRDWFNQYVVAKYDGYRYQPVEQGQTGRMSGDS